MNDVSSQTLDAPGAAPSGTGGGSRASTRDTILIGVGLIALFFLLLYLLLSLWPSASISNARGDSVEAILWFGSSRGFAASADTRLLLLVLVSGGIGSFVHTATSFADFVGNERLTTNWIWWYVLRPFIGMALAAIFYVTLRAGFLTSAGQPATINLFGVSSMAGLVGMFSKQATDKLNEMFDTLFRTASGGGDLSRKDGLPQAGGNGSGKSLTGNADARSAAPPAPVAPPPPPEPSVRAGGIDAEAAHGVPDSRITPDAALPAARGGVA